MFDSDSNLRWLFCMTHPDDEISICAWMRRLVVQGNDVFISWTHATPVRRSEAEAVAGLIGVPQDQLYFHEGADGRVCDQMSDLLPGFKSMVRDLTPDRIACGAFEQGHLDHDATNLLVNSSFAGSVLEIPFYHTYLSRCPTLNRFASGTAGEMIELNPDEQAFKVSVARSYPSQAIWRNLVLDEARRALFRQRSQRLKSRESMRFQTHKDFLSPNLPPALAKRVRSSANWRRWESAVRAIL